MAIKESYFNSWLTTNWWQKLIIIVLILGIFFRFANLERKYYWRDEALTSLQISGFTIAEVSEKLANGQEVSISELQKYQSINSERNILNTIKVIAVETPEHPPLYYAMARLWAEWFGTSETAMRSLPAILSLFVFPCLYWLCLELFRSPTVAWLAIALVAVSPFHILYAQEAREYSFWTATTLLSSVTLLRAMRLNTKKSWLIYAISLALTLYTYLFSVYVAIGHGIYVIVSEGFQFNKKVINYLLSAIAGTLLFLPWIVVVIVNMSALKSSMAWINYVRISIPELVARWLFNISRIFLDWNLEKDFNSLIPYFTTIAYVALVAYSLYFLCRQTPQRVWMFVLALMGTIMLAILLPDLIIGGVRSKVLRYLIPFYLGIELAVAYLLANKINSISASNKQRKIWQIVTLAVISTGLLSCAISSLDRVWWTKSYSTNIIQTVETINRVERPLVIGDCSITDFLSLSHELDPKVKFQIFYNLGKMKIANNYSNIFLFDSSEKLRQKLQKEYKLKPVIGSNNLLWRIEK